MLRTLSDGCLNHFEEALGWNPFERAPNNCVPYHAITESSNAGNTNCWCLSIQKGPSKLREQGGTQFDKWRQRENLGHYFSLIMLLIPNTLTGVGDSEVGFAYAEPWLESFELPSIDISDAFTFRCNGLNNIAIFHKPWSIVPFITNKKLIETLSMYSLDVHTQFKPFHYYIMGYIDYENE